jgi:hypothetical protein
MDESQLQRLFLMSAVDSLSMTAAVIMSNDKCSMDEAVEKAYELRRKSGKLIGKESRRRGMDLVFGNDTV